MRMRLTLWIPVVALLLLHGCASTPEGMDQSSAVDKSRGVLLATITHDGNPQVLDAWFYFRRKGSTDEQRLDAHDNADMLIRGFALTQKAGPAGRLLAVPLEPGDYELFNWTLYVSRLGGYAYIGPKDPPPVHRFAIRPGVVTYLGELHLDAVLGKNPFGVSLVFGAAPAISDQSVRDRARLPSRYPGLVDWPMDVAVPDPAGWSPAR